MLRCRLLGHDWHFYADAETMRWKCGRCGGAAGEKRYESAMHAEGFARAFDRRDSDDMGRRAPVSVFPVRIARALRGRRPRRGG
jgi:hypothetical protein